MSYMHEKREDSLNELFGRLNDFNNVKNNLIESKTSESFVIWLDKLIKIDKRSLYFFIKNNKAKISEDNLEIIQSFYKVKI